MDPRQGRPPRGLYLITPDEADTARLLARVAPLLGQDVAWLQYRNKAADAALRREQATALQALCSAAGVPLLVNDDAALALAIGAAGAHLGEDDGDVAAARALLGPDAIVGASCYDRLDLAGRAVAIDGIRRHRARPPASAQCSEARMPPASTRRSRMASASAASGTSSR